MPKRKRNDAAKKIQRRFKRTRKSRYIPLNFPNSKMVRLRYVQEISIDPNDSTISTYTFSANGMFDPDVTSVIAGHQPKCFDQYMGVMYDHYTVIGSKCTVKYVSSSRSDATPGYFGVALTDSNLTLNGRSKTEVMETKNTSKFGVTGNSLRVRDQTRTAWFSAKKFFKKSAIIGDGTYRGTATSNPSEEANYQIWMFNIGGNDPAVGNFLVTIDYLACLSEPKVVGSS